MTRHRNNLRRVLPVMQALWLVTGGFAFAQAAWLNDKASLKVELRITGAPSTPEAGIVAVIPDAGLLPRPFPVPVVHGSDGRLLNSEVLWYNPDQGMAVVFSPPAAGDDVSIYFSAASARLPARGKSAFCPSLLLFTKDRVMDASLEQAFKLADTLVSGSDVRMGWVPCIGQRENLLGNDDYYLSYYTGWIKRAKGARVYFATISDEGSELRVDGKPVAVWPGLHTREAGARGQYGGWVELSAGLHRIEYFHFEREGAQETQAAWRIPGETLGALPVMIPDYAFVRSGQTRITRAAFRDGRPVAAVNGSTQATSYFWFLNLPVNLYNLEADLTTGNASNTVYAWSLGQDRRYEGRTLDWLAEGNARGPIILSASNAQGVTRIAVPLLAYETPPKANVDSLFDRQAFRKALLIMCRAVPADKDPCASWSPDLWTTLVAVSEPYRGYDLVREVFSRSPSVRKVMAPADRQFLQDILIGCMRILNPTNVPKCLDRLEEQSSDRAAKQHLERERFDYTLYDLQDIQPARALATAMLDRAVTTEDSVLAQIRMGDVERASGNIEDAEQLYGTAQDRYRNSASSSMVMQRLKMSTLASGKPRGGKRRAEEAHTNNSPAVTLRATGQSWKTFAVQEAAFLATARNLIQKGFLFEARDVLQKWELEVPLCKLSGDYSIAEAEYFMAAQHYVRALAGLRIYRKTVDVSESLPEAMGLEMDCLAQLKRKAEAVELARDVLKRFPNHPVAERARSVLDNGI